MLTATKNSQSQCRARSARQNDRKGSECSPPGQQEVLTALRPQDLHGQPLSLRPALQLSAKTASSAATSTPQTPRKARPRRASLPCRAWNGMDLTWPNQVSSGDMTGQHGRATVMVLCNGRPPVMSQPQSHTQSQNKSHSYGYAYGHGYGYGHSRPAQDVAGCPSHHMSGQA